MHLVWAALACTSDTEDSTPPVAATCEAPASAVTYVEAGQDMGLIESPDPDGPHGEGGSAAVLDVDDDGDLDIVVMYARSPLRLYRRNGDRFDLEELDAGHDPWLLSLADVDADGHLDLLVGGGQPVLLRGNGAGFEPREDLPTKVEPNTLFQVSKALAPADLDGDGAIDLYAVVNAAGGEPEGDALADHVLWGAGDGTFTVGELPATAERRGFDASVVPWGDTPAVYVVNDMGPDFGGNVLFSFDGRDATDRTSDCDCGIEHSAMGLDVGDWNADGRADLYVAAVPWNALYTAQAGGGFVENAFAVGAEGIKLQAEFGMTWGAAFIDFDNDGQQDILDAQGDFWFPDDPNLPYLPQPLWLLRQDDGQFTEVGEALGFEQEASHRSVIADDHNGDGVLDLLVTDVVEAPRLYLSQGCTANGWLEVEAPQNSRVEVTVGDRTQTLWTQTKSGYGGAREPRVHVGLGASLEVDALVVTPPNGAPRSLDGPFEAQRTLTFDEL